MNLSWYFDGSSWLFKSLRFLNLLEPDRCVLSKTKVILWAFVISGLIAFNGAATWQDKLAIGIAMVTAMAKDEWRRAQQNEV